MSSTIAEFAAVLRYAEKKVDARPVWLRGDDSSDTQREREPNAKPTGNGRGTQKKRS
jgi:hypothetical protein